MFALVIKCYPRAGERGVTVNMVPFGRKDLIRFLEAIEALGIRVRLDPVVADRLGRGRQ